MDTRPAVGSAAPDIVLEQHGTTDPWSLADQRGRTIVLIFHRHIH